MARFVSVADDREITDPAEVAAALTPLGVSHEEWEVAGRAGPDATDEEVLEAYNAEIEWLKQNRGYATADVINVNPATPGLDDMMATFSREHTHPDDEVRFTVSGHGVFYVRLESGAVVAAHVEAGDLINVPAGTKHWFELSEDRTIRCIRLFNNPEGWKATFVDGEN